MALKRIIVGIIWSLLVTSGYHQVLAMSAEDVAVHGFASQGFILSSDNNFLAKSKDGDFEFAEAAVNVSAQLTDELRAGLQLFSRDLGDIGNFDVSLDWGYLDYRFQDSLGLRIGKFKLPLGLYNEIQDYDMLRTSILLPQSVYTLTMRETMIAAQGLSTYGHLELGRGGDLDYQLFVGTTQIDPQNGGLAIDLRDSDVDLQKSTVKSLFGGSIKWNTPLTGLLAGIGMMQVDLDFRGPPIGATKDALAVALPFPVQETHITLPNLALSFYSLQYVYNNLTLTAEFSRQVGAQRTFAVGAAPVGEVLLEDRHRDTTGYYLQAAYRVNDLLEIGGYYSMYYLGDYEREDCKLANTTYCAEDIALSARFDINKYWIIKAEVHQIDGGAYLFNIENPDGLKKDWNLFLLKTSISF